MRSTCEISARYQRLLPEYYKYVKEKHNKRQAMKENKFFAETFRMEEYGIFSGYGTTVYI